MKKKSLPAKNHSIVGIGASAGGLEAFQQLFAKMPEDTGMVFVLIQHLDPSHPSLSVEILRRNQKLRVEEIKDGVKVRPDHVYVIPPNYNVSIEKGVLRLQTRSEKQSLNMPIDLFFQSLARSEKERAIGIVLSGTGSDGTQGLLAIKSEGGIGIAQEPKSAKYSGMPQNAIAAGAADIVLPPEDIPEELNKIGKHDYRSEDEIETAGALTKILQLLHTHTKVDFANYKPNTIQRRIERRMVVNKTKTLSSYVNLLAKSSEEIQALYNDLLINVTEFFRDPEAFNTLKQKVFPALIKNRPEGATIRIWVPGCATGEEVYSIAISLLEYLNQVDRQNPIQIFATDISDKALQKARTGFFSDEATKKLSENQLKRFFDKVAGGYKIHKFIRDICLFSHHDVTNDPPFAKLDLVSCRNILIYFSANLQKRVIPIFHYSLLSGGFLWLGKSEHTGEFSKLFSQVDKTHKIYLKSNLPTPINFHFSNKTLPAAETKNMLSPLVTTVDFKKEADKIILSKFAPASVVVNSDLEILQFRGRTFPFLEPVTGKPSLNLLKMARPELMASLRRLIQLAKKENKAANSKSLHFATDGRSITVNIDVVPINRLASVKERTFLIVFTEVEASDEVALPKNAKGKTANQGKKKIADLRRELDELKEYHRALMEQYEATQDELTSANEELQSTNEEFLSTNEETETAKEELQSTNEELITVNDELQVRNTELTALSSDLNNLLASIDIPVVMVGRDQRIRLISPKAKGPFNLIPTDIGRLISDIKPTFNLNLASLVAEVAEDLTPREIEIQDHLGHWIRVQVRPYKAPDNKIDGAIIALIDFDFLKQKEIKTKVALEYITAVAETVPLPLAVIDGKFEIQSANRSFFAFFQSKGDPVSQNIFNFLNLEDAPTKELTARLKAAHLENKTFTDFEMKLSVPNKGQRILFLSGGKIHWSEGDQNSALLGFLDVTEQKHLEEERRTLLTLEKEARNLADKANEAKDVFLATLSHELRTPLSSILTWAQLIRKGKVDTDEIIQGAEVIEKSAKTQSQLIDDLLDISRIISGKLVMKPVALDPCQTIRSAVESVSSMAEKKSIRIESDLESSESAIQADPVRMQQIIWNLLTNAIKFSPPKSVINIDLKYIGESANRRVQIKVRDQGKGIPPEFLPHIFNRFSQADSASTRVHGGLGLGLSIVQNLVKLQNGEVKADNLSDGKGAVFTVTFPVLNEKPSDLKETTPQIKISSGTPDLTGLRILLVDDDESARESMLLCLKIFGAEVKTADSAMAGFESLQSFAPDILVSDIAMPGEDGYSLIKKVRARGNRHDSNTPALALTAYATADDVRQVLSAGFQGHLSKPIDVNDLVRSILEVAKQKSKAN